MHTIEKVTVFCGASPGNHQDYTLAAKKLGQYLGEQGLTVVYGGTNVGLMGLMANEVITAGGQIEGVIPIWLKEKGIAHSALKRLHIVNTMHERKAKMAELSDAFIALPGGIGTLEELFEVWTWSKMGVHRKPCGLLNVRGYYDTLKTFIDHMVAEAFLKQEHNNILVMEDSPEKLIESFRRYQHPEDMWNTIEDFKKAGIG